MKITIGTFLGSLLLLITLPSRAATLSVNPASQTVTQGASFNVDLVISGLGDSVAPSLGTYDLYFNYDPAIVSFNAASYGDLILGDQLDIAQLGSFTITTPEPDRVQLYQLSFDTVDDLNNFQADTFTLATLSFNALIAGNSPFSLSLNAVSDAAGDFLALDTQGGSVNVTAIPLPSAWLLFATGSLLLSRIRRKGI